MLSMQLSKRFVQQIVLDGFAFVGIRNNLLDCYRLSKFSLFPLWKEGFLYPTIFKYL